MITSHRLSPILSNHRRQLIQLVVDSGVLPKVVAYLGHPEINVVMPALRIAGNVISGSDVQTQAAVDAGALKALVPLLSHQRRNVRREACWAVSNVAAGTAEQIEALMTVPGLVAAVIGALKSGEWNVRKEAAWVVSNIATTGAPEHVRQLVSAGAVEALTDTLTSADARMLCVVLDAVSAILSVGKRLADSGAGPTYAFAETFEEGGLLGHLEALQDHENEDVYAKCVEIIERFYGVEEDDRAGGENVMAPAASAAGGFSFGLGAAPTSPAGGLAPTQLFASPGAHNSNTNHNMMMMGSAAAAAAASSSSAASCGPMFAMPATMAAPTASAAPVAFGGFANISFA